MMRDMKQKQIDAPGEQAAKAGRQKQLPPYPEHDGKAKRSKESRGQLNQNCLHLKASLLP